MHRSCAVSCEGVFRVIFRVGLVPDIHAIGAIVVAMTAVTAGKPCPRVMIDFYAVIQVMGKIA